MANFTFTEAYGNLIEDVLSSPALSYTLHDHIFGEKDWFEESYQRGLLPLLFQTGGASTATPSEITGFLGMRAAQEVFEHLELPVFRMYGDFSFGVLGRVWGTVEGYEVSYRGEIIASLTDIGTTAGLFWQSITSPYGPGLDKTAFKRADEILGSDYNDHLRGGRGRDVIDGGAGNDSVFGGVGNDTLLSSSGHDTIFGETGNDRIETRHGNSNLFGGKGRDTIHGGEESRSYLSGGKGADSLAAGAAGDGIYGNGGDDTLIGGSGDDRLEGGIGSDVLSGGEGTDYFDFGYKAWIANREDADRITDWETGEWIQIRIADRRYRHIETEQVADDVVIHVLDNTITVENAVLEEVESWLHVGNW